MGYVDKNTEEELKQKITDLYNYMSERNIGEVALTFKSGNKMKCSIQHKPIHVSLDEVLGE